MTNNMIIAVSGNNIPVKKAKQSIEFIRHMATLGCYDVTDVKCHGAIKLLTSPPTFISDYEIQRHRYLKEDISDYPKLYYRTNAFGVEVELSNDRCFELNFIKNKKALYVRGYCNFNELWGDDEQKRTAINDFIWTIHTLEAVQQHFITGIKINDTTKYHKPKLTKCEIRAMKKHDNIFSTSNYKEWKKNVPNDIKNVLKTMGWTNEVLDTRPVQSGRMRVLRERTSNTNSEYEHIPYIRQCIEMSLGYFGISTTPNSE